MLIVNEPKPNDVEVSFLCNPVVEMVSSLHVLADPSHHRECIGWAEQILSKLQTELKNEINFFAQNFNEWVLIMDVVCHVCDDQTQKARATLEKISELPILEFSYWFLSGFIGYDRLKALLQNPDELQESDIKSLKFYLKKDAIRYFLNHAEEVQRRLVWVLTEFWETVFESEWKHIALFEYETVDAQSRLYEEKGLREYLETCHSDMFVEENIIKIRKQTNFEIDLGRLSKVIVIPSMFTAPHFMMSWHPDVLTIYKNIPFRADEFALAEIPQEVDYFLKAVSNTVRLKMMKTLSVECKTTTELAEIFKLRPSTVSAHLTTLKEAGLVYSVRNANSVYYYFNYQVYKDNADFLASYFE